MALAARPHFSVFLAPFLRPITRSSSLLRRRSPLLQALPVPVLSAFAALPALLPVLPRLPSLLDLWDSVLRAVPKKKTSYRKKRQRFLAGKALKDVTSLVKCPACGRPKRAHHLCPYCVEAIQKKLFKSSEK